MDLLGRKDMDITSLAMEGLLARHKALTSNIANANTPSYSRTDVAFEGQLKKILETDDAKEKNIEIKNPLQMSGFKPQIIMSNEPTKEGNINNVNVEVEMAELAKNSMQFNALAAIQAKSFRELSEVINGSGK